jgi:hypothetical protein
MWATIDSANKRIRTRTVNRGIWFVKGGKKNLRTIGSGQRNYVRGAEPQSLLCSVTPKKNTISVCVAS